MDAMTFQGHGLVNFSKANGFKFCKIKNPLRHIVKLSKLWKITRIKKKKKQQKKTLWSWESQTLLVPAYRKQEYSNCIQAKDLTRDADYSKDQLNKRGKPMHYYLEHIGTRVL